MARPRNLLQHWTWGMSLLFGAIVFWFWWRVYPHALSYQEQYQLFLWTMGYFLKSVSTLGGFATWLGEFFTQFYYYEWLGALVLSVLYVTLQRLTWQAMQRRLGRREDRNAWYLLSFFPSALLVWLMGNPNVLLSFVIALELSVAAALALPVLPDKWKNIAVDVIAVPALYWLLGPVVWVYVGLRAVWCGWQHVCIAVYLLAVQLLTYHFVLLQDPLCNAMQPYCNYRIPLTPPILMWIVMATMVALALVPRKGFGLPGHFVQGALLLLLCYEGALQGFAREMYELIWQDYKVRNERWDEIVERAERYQVRTPFSCVCVNLALAQKQQLADRMFSFYQSGEDALVMPRIRDLTSMLPSCEAFWRLGMINASLRYAFDTQESILNGKKSGRCTKRIAECMLVNGQYKTTRKHLEFLKKSLFYRSWAKEAEHLLGNEALINAHPVYGKLRQLRYHDDFLFSQQEMDKMFGLLFMNNKNNRMALDYFMGQMLLKGELRGFQQYMPWVQQYGGYRQMPLGYQDAMYCIQKQGAVPGSPYAGYAKRMMAERRNREISNEAH